MVDPKSSRSFRATLAIGLAGVFVCAANASPVNLTVQDPRPVAKAIEELEARYGWQITYEDPPYGQEDDMPDVTPLVQEGAAAVPAMPDAMVRTGRLSFALPSAGQAKASVVRGIVNSYNLGGRGNAFTVVEGPGVLHVVPQTVTGASGTPTPVKSILDARIKIEPGARPALALLEEVCTKLSAETRTTVVVGNVPANMLSNANVSIGSSAITARTVLEILIRNVGAPLSWRLFYDPEYKMYALNIDIVKPPNQH